MKTRGLAYAPLPSWRTLMFGARRFVPWMTPPPPYTLEECLPCARPARYFYDEFPRLSPQVYHYRMEPPSRPIAASCLPNEATNHPRTTLNKKSISESPSQLCSTKFVRSR